MKQVRRLLDSVDAPWYSDHLCFGAVDGIYLHDLLPLPFTKESVRTVSARVAELEDALQRPVAIENISYYADPADPGGWSEVDFLLEVLDASGGKLLLDVNNIYVNSINHGFDPKTYIDRVPAERIVQMHVAGHFTRPDGLIIDTHGEAICEGVYELLEVHDRHARPEPGALGAGPELSFARRAHRRAGAAPVDLRSRDEGVRLGDVRAEGRSMTELVAMQRAFRKICFDAEPAPEDLAVLHDEDARWLLYRRMVRSRLVALARQGLPKTAKLIGESELERAMSAYLADGGPRTRFLREVVFELVEHAAEAWRARDDLPEHLMDLARFEAAKWRTSAAVSDSEPATELDFELPPVFNPTTVAVPIQFRVDKDAESPARLEEPHLALTYRKSGDPKVYVYVLNAIGARLFSAWREGGSCADGTRRVLADLGREPDAKFVDGMAGVLADLVEQEIVVGSRPSL